MITTTNFNFLSVAFTTSTISPYTGSTIALGYGIFIVALIVFILLISFFLSPQFRFSGEKQTSYECGFEPFGDARLTFDIHFYIIGILFLIFDLELVFLFPWLFSFVEQTSIISSNLASMFSFLFLLGLGFAYEWQNNALVWIPVQRDL
jgi:NADH-quinone oxidoreductase subunit A